MLLGLGTALAAQIYRYRRVSTPAQQQQTKWVVFGFAAAILGFAAVSALLWLTPWARGIAFLQFLYAHWSFYLSQLIVPLCIGISILRYRLWDIDLVINRTIVYTITVALVVALFYALSSAGDKAVQAILGETSAAAPLASVLVSAMVFSPLKERTQKAVDRRFYRDKVDLQSAFADFSREIRRLTNVDALLLTLVDTVVELLHLQHGAVYVSADGGSFKLAAAQNLPEPQPQEWAAPSALPHLQKGLAVSQPDDRLFPLLIPLTLPPAASAGSADWARWLGVLALGPRLSGRGFSREDRALLLTLADQAGTAIYVALTLK
jgi:GAF domain-containing protein